MLTIANSLLELIRAHALDAYPNECNGLIVGDYQSRTAAKVYPVKNVHTETTRTRYQIDPKQHLQIERQARAAGQEVIAVYHSHPDAPAKPSAHDREHAWPSYAYIIVSVVHGRADRLQAWTLREDGTAFEEEQLRVIE